MDSVGVIFAILIAILASGALVRVIPFSIPLPLIQIVLGMIVAGVFKEGITLEPHLFFLVFIPPLLFLDGWRMPNSVLKKERVNIFQLAFGLVLFTMLGLGYIIHWMIPSMPLPIAFALAAILSPTDPVAVAGIARKLAVPERVMSILEGEALFNDASGLVAFRMAVLVAITGSFSFYKAATTFLWVAIAGILVGIATTWLLSYVRRQFTNKYGEELGSEILLSLLMPFIAYMIAETIEASGVLAAVAAGITMSRLELHGGIEPMTRMRRSAIWDTVQFTLNGAIFVILGEQLPAIFNIAVGVVTQTGHQSVWWLLIYAFVICFTLILFRFAWVFVSINITYAIKHKRRLPLTHPNVRDMLVVSIGGVRGAITLAGVMTLPLLLPNGDEFPTRDLAIFLAATVIIISLLMASVLLPILLKDVQAEADIQSPLALQKKIVVAAAKKSGEKHIAELLAKLQHTHPQLTNEYYQDLTQRLWVEFENGFDPYRDPDNLDHQRYEVERSMRLVIIDAARQAIFHLAKEHKISDDVSREMVKQLDFDEVRIS